MSGKHSLCSPTEFQGEVWSGQCKWKYVQTCVEAVTGSIALLMTLLKTSFCVLKVTSVFPTHRRYLGGLPKYFSTLFLHSSVLPIWDGPLLSVTHSMSCCALPSPAVPDMLCRWSERKVQQYLLLVNEFTKVQHLTVSLYLITDLLLPKSYGTILFFTVRTYDVISKSGPYIDHLLWWPENVSKFKWCYWDFPVKTSDTYRKEKWSKVGQDTPQCVYVEESCQSSVCEGRGLQNWGNIRWICWGTKHKSN